MGGALALALEIGFELIIGDVRRTLAILAWLRGEPDRARALLVDALARAERSGDVEPRELCQLELEKLQTSPDLARSFRWVEHEPTGRAGRRPFSRGFVWL